MIETMLKDSDMHRKDLIGFYKIPIQKLKVGDCFAILEGNSNKLEMHMVVDSFDDCDFDPTSDEIIGSATWKDNSISSRSSGDNSHFGKGGKECYRNTKYFRQPKSKKPYSYKCAKRRVYTRNLDTLKEGLFLGNCRVRKYEATATEKAQVAPFMK